MVVINAEPHQAVLVITDHPCAAAAADRPLPCSRWIHFNSRRSSRLLFTALIQFARNRQLSTRSRSVYGGVLLQRLIGTYDCWWPNRTRRMSSLLIHCVLGHRNPLDHAMSLDPRISVKFRTAKEYIPTVGLWHRLLGFKMC